MERAAAQLARGLARLRGLYEIRVDGRDDPPSPEATALAAGAYAEPHERAAARRGVLAVAVWQAASARLAHPLDPALLEIRSPRTRRSTSSGGCRRRARRVSLQPILPDGCTGPDHARRQQGVRRGRCAGVCDARRPGRPAHRGRKGCASARPTRCCGCIWPTDVRQSRPARRHPAVTIPERPVRSMCCAATSHWASSTF